MQRNERRWQETFLQVAIAFGAYLLLALPIQASGAYRFADGVGVKNALPFVLGLFYGPSGVIGCILAAIVTGVLLHVGAALTTAEAFGVLVAGMGIWLLWFLWHRNGSVRLERGRDFLRYTGIVAGLSLACGGLAGMLLERSMILPTFLGYLIFGLLVGGLITILLGGIFCVDPVLPAWCLKEPDVPVLLEPGSATLDQINESIEEQSQRQKIPMKRIFEIQNCLEELVIRIRKHMPEAEVRGWIDLGTTISMRLFIPGVRYNPLRVERNEEEIDLMSLKLIRHRALRAYYSYKNTENRIHIVI